MNTSVYIAAPWPMKKEAKQLRAQLLIGAVHCTSRWLDVETPLGAHYAKQDLDDVCTADALVAINPLTWKNRGTGGRHVEMGVAIQRAMPIFLIGVRTNIFHELPRVVIVEDVEQLLPLLHELNTRRQAARS